MPVLTILTPLTGKRQQLLQSSANNPPKTMGCAVDHGLILDITCFEGAATARLGNGYTEQLRFMANHQDRSFEAG
ncbi:hypothetical protein [Mycolicibacterium elephantis]|uniref:hypothetical protein n=1 Tax=Mycolicibacterium elephantis TaxID=81858 RepID=UPI001041D310|nr:hypothetical protein [Mycolicibacterium elephantis]